MRSKELRRPRREFASFMVIIEVMDPNLWEIELALHIL